jgi:hypothetical protein
MAGALILAPFPASSLAASSPAKTAVRSVVPGRYTGQRLAWSRCAPTAADPVKRWVECTGMRAPMDWNHPDREGDLGMPWQPRLSADGSVALFTSNADDLVPRDLNNRGYGGDIFAHRLR